MELELEKVLVEFGGAIVAIFAIAETVKYVIGIFLAKYIADLFLPLLTNYKIMYGLAGLAYLLTLITLISLALISVIVGIYGFKLYSAGSRLSREKGEKWLVRILLIMFVSLILGAFIVFLASGAALAGIIIALFKRD